MLSLLLHPLGSETLPTTERRREKRNSFAVGNKEKKYYDFSSPFAKNMERNFICNRECVWYLQKQLYILCLVTCNKWKALSWTRTCIHKSINFLKNIFSIQSFLLLSVHTVSEYLATRALEKCSLCKSRVFDYSKKTYQFITWLCFFSFLRLYLWFICPSPLLPHLALPGSSWRAGQ